MRSQLPANAKIEIQLGAYEDIFGETLDDIEKSRGGPSAHFRIHRSVWLRPSKHDFLDDSFSLTDARF